MNEVKSLGVVGAGQMGAGIAHVAALRGFSVILSDVSASVVETAVQGIARGYDRQVEKGKLTAAERAEAIGRIRGTTRVGDMGDVDFAIEAVSEDEGLKRRVLAELDATMKEPAILATNTSSISITRLASTTRRSDRFIGMHFMNPVPVMTLVEIIPGLQTSERTLQVTRTFSEALGKKTIKSEDQPGFVVNRILLPMINEAVFALGEGLASPEDIDAAMKLGTNQPMGPLELADFIGLDTCLSILEVLHRGLGDPKYRPAPLLRRYVDAGWLGRKTGRGFFVHSKK